MKQAISPIVLDAILNEEVVPFSLRFADVMSDIEIDPVKDPTDKRIWASRTYSSRTGNSMDDDPVEDTER